MIGPTLELVEAGQDLSMDQMADAVGTIMEGKSTEDQISRLLVGLHKKGESVEEVAGAALAMRRHMTPIHSMRPDLVDVVGTGGDGSRTFNISTAAALVTAAAGVPVAKHGNRAMTSKTGSADVLAELGVNIKADVPTVEACLEELGICFCFAPLLHKAMKHVSHVRKKLGTPTLFNILGPLANPAGAQLQLLGVSSPELQVIMADVLNMLECRRALVVHGEGGLDEVTLCGETQVIEINDGQRQEYTWTPEDFGLEKIDIEDIRVDGTAASAQRIRGVLQNRPGPERDIVVANTAAALWLAGRGATVGQCVPLAVEALESGAAADLLANLVERTNEPVTSSK